MANVQVTIGIGRAVMQGEGSLQGRHSGTLALLTCWTRQSIASLAARSHYQHLPVASPCCLLSSRQCRSPLGCLMPAARTPVTAPRMPVQRRRTQSHRDVIQRTCLGCSMQFRVTFGRVAADNLSSTGLSGGARHHSPGSVAPSQQSWP